MADVGMIVESGDGLIVLTNGSFGGYVHGQIRCAWRNWLMGRERACPGAIGPVVVSTTMREGVEAAVTRYRKLRSESPDAYDFDENQLNQAGYGLVQKGRVADALVLFRLNVEMFPESWNPWDSLGEANGLAGNDTRAIECFEKSLQLNPDNTNAVRALEQLRAVSSAP